MSARIGRCAAALALTMISASQALSQNEAPMLRVATGVGAKALGRARRLDRHTAIFTGAMILTEMILKCVRFPPGALLACGAPAFALV